MPKILICQLIIGASLLLSACSTSTTIDGLPASKITRERNGQIERIHIVEVKDSSGIGSIAGGVIGGIVAGKHIGSGTGSTISSVFGALLGGFLGNQMEREMRQKSAQELTIQMQDNGERARDATGVSSWTTSRRHQQRANCTRPSTHDAAIK